MSRKKARVPSRNSLAINQRISQLFENLEYDSEIADPIQSEEQLHIPEPEPTHYDTNFKDRILPDVNHYPKSRLFSTIQIPPPEPSGGFDLKDINQSQSQVTDRKWLNGYRVEGKSVKKMTNPITQLGTDLLLESGTEYSPGDTDSPEIIAASQSFANQRSGYQYQLFLEFVNDQTKPRWNEADRYLVENFLSLLVFVLERSPELE